MKKMFLAIAMLLLFAASAIAIDIPKDCRVANIPPGYCCWACLESLGKFHKISNLDNLLESRSKENDVIIFIPSNGGFIQRVEPKNFGYDHAIYAKLTELKVKFRMNMTGEIDRSLLQHVNSHGCLIGLKAGARGELAHGVVLTYIDDKIIRFYDSNQPDSTWEGSREWFDYWWSGMIVVLEK